MKTIAIIDDDIHIQDVLKEILTKENYHILRAYSCTEALYLLEQNTPDLVLLDLMLPGLSGEEVLPYIQNIPVIVLSAKVDVQDKVNLLLENPKQVIAKGILLDRISLDTPDCTERSLKQHISNLRKKLQDVNDVDYIETVWGIGFKLAEQKS